MYKQNYLLSMLQSPDIFISSNELFFDFHDRFQKRRSCMKLIPTTMMSTADLKLSCRKTYISPYDALFCF